MKLNTTYNSVDVVNGITRKEFEEKYFYPQKPVVIKGLFDHCDATKKWSFQFFKDEMGDVEVGVFDGVLEKAEKTFKEPDYTMRFRDYLEEIEKGPTKKRLFLFNAVKVNKKLLDDFEFPNISNSLLKSLPFMFFGGDGSIARIHQDMDMSCVFLTHFEGKKRVVLFDPKYSELLYRYPYSVHTGVNINNPDYEKYPGLKYVKGSEVMLEFGDTLFMPAGWWHHIEYLGSGFSMSQRCLSPNKMDTVKGALNVAIKTHFDEVMLKIFGNNWFHYKERMAIKRAKHQIEDLEEQELVG